MCGHSKKRENMFIANLEQTSKCRMSTDIYMKRILLQERKKERKTYNSSSQKWDYFSQWNNL